MKNALKKWQIQSARTQKIIIWPFIENIANSTKEPKVAKVTAFKSYRWSQSVSQWVTVKRRQWSDLGPIKSDMEQENTSWDLELDLAEQRWSFLSLSWFHKNECDNVNDENDWTGVWFFAFKIFSLPVPSHHLNFSPSTHPSRPEVKNHYPSLPCLYVSFYCNRTHLMMSERRYVKPDSKVSQ